MARIIAIGGVLSGVSGALLAIYQNEVRDFLDNLLSQLFGIPKGVVGYYVVAVVILALIVFCVLVVLNWLCKRIRGPPREKKPERKALAIESGKFEARILYKKSSYRMGDKITFWAKYTGKLDKGYHVIQVSSLSGATIPKGNDWWSDPATYHNPNGSGHVGKLIVPPPYEYKASRLLTDFPIGEYQIAFEIGEGKLNEGKRLASAKDIFVVGSSESEVKESESAQADLKRKEDIWKAIKEWVDSAYSTDSILGLGNCYDFPLGRAPPKLAKEIDDCLSKYPSLWHDLQEFRNKCALRGRVLRSPIQDAYDGFVGMNERLVQRFRSEILDKHWTRLRC